MRRERGESRCPEYRKDFAAPPHPPLRGTLYVSWVLDWAVFRDSLSGAPPPDRLGVGRVVGTLGF